MMGIISSHPCSTHARLASVFPSVEWGWPLPSTPRCSQAVIAPQRVGAHKVPNPRFLCLYPQGCHSQALMSHKRLTR